MYVFEVNSMSLSFGIVRVQSIELGRIKVDHTSAAPVLDLESLEVLAILHDLDERL